MNNIEVEGEEKRGKRNRLISSTLRLLLVLEKRMDYLRHNL
jgi:hypothetical protein